MNSDDLIGYPAARRVSVIILTLVIILAAVVLGLYTWFGGTAPKTKKSNSTTNSHLTAPVPTSKANTKTQSSSVASNVGSNSAAAASTISAPAPAQLTNTGPGNSVLVAFIAAVALGTAGHYLWRRFALAPRD